MKQVLYLVLIAIVCGYICKEDMKSKVWGSASLFLLLVMLYAVDKNTTKTAFVTALLTVITVVSYESLKSTKYSCSAGISLIMSAMLLIVSIASPLRTDEEQNKEVKSVINALQNVDDDSIVMPVQALQLTYGDGETDIVKRYEQGRTVSKSSERQFLVENYLKEYKIGKTDKPKVVMVMSTLCSSCQKYFNILSNVDLDNKNYELIIFVRKTDKKTDYSIPANLLEYCITLPKEDLPIPSSRVPATAFLTSDNRLYDYGGLIHPDRIEQIVGDQPK